jgi:hypothetical protein
LPSTAGLPENTEYTTIVRFDTYAGSNGTTRFGKTTVNISPGSKYRIENECLYYDTTLMLYLGLNETKTVAIAEGTTTICRGAFFYCDKITIPVIPDTVKKIEDDAFSGDENSTRRYGPIIEKFDFYTDCVLSRDSFAGAKISELNIVYVDGHSSIPDHAFSKSLLQGLVTIPEGITEIETYAFQGCLEMTSVVIPRSCTSIGHWAFGGCIRLGTITSLAEIAPIASTWAFGKTRGDHLSTPTSTAFTGSIVTYPILRLSIPNTGYDDSEGWCTLRNDCRFTVETLFTPQECTSLTITADDVSGRKTNTFIHWTAIVNGVDTWTEETRTGVEIKGTVDSEMFPQNTSYTDTVEREVSFTYLGVTATTTITQGVWVDASYTVDLNSQWQESTTIANPDSLTYDGVYESFSNKGVGNTAAIMYIDIKGYETFKFYVRSNAEATYDFVVVSNLDATLTNSTTSGTAVKLTTSGKQTSGTAISNYQLVEFTGIDGGEHRISVMYRKDGSGNNGDDRGYVLIPKNQ